MPGDAADKRRTGLTVLNNMSVWISVPSRWVPRGIRGGSGKHPSPPQRRLLVRDRHLHRRSQERSVFNRQCGQDGIGYQRTDSTMFGYQQFQNPGMTGPRLRDYSSGPRGRAPLWRIGVIGIEQNIGVDDRHRCCVSRLGNATRKRSLRVCRSDAPLDRLSRFTRSNTSYRARR